MLDDDDVVSAISELDWQIQVYGYLWTMRFADYCVVAHSAYKRNIVPMTKHTVAKMVLWPVTFLVEVVC